MTAIKLFYLFLCLMISACATPYGAAIKSYQEVRVCCKSMEEFEYSKLTIPQSFSFDINENSKAYLFDTGKSYFKSFELPQFKNSYQINIKSHMLGDHINNAYILVPHVIILDKDYKIIRSLGKEIFHLEKASLTETWGIRYKFESTIDFNEENKNERYLVILTTEELLKMKTSISSMKVTPIVLPGIVGAIPIGKEEKLVPHSPIGRITISVNETPVTIHSASPSNMNDELMTPIDRELASNISISSDWAEIVPTPPLKPKKTVQGISIQIEGLKGMPNPRQISLSDGTDATPEVQIIDEVDNIYNLDIISAVDYGRGKPLMLEFYISSTSPTDFPKDLLKGIKTARSFPKDRVYTKVRIRSDRPFRCLRVVWHCWSPT